jgi:hypothetical protein
MANRMIQYLSAVRICREVPGCFISNISLPEWGINVPSLLGNRAIDLEISSQDIEADRLVTMLRTGQIRTVHLNSYCQSISNFGDYRSYGTVFPDDSVQFPGFDGDHIVFNIRGGEVLDARHLDYTLIPIGFYKDIIRETGKRAVFMGQVESNCYCDALRESFPDAIFRESRGAIDDFQTFRNSKNICLSVSTFSWLAALLSDADLIVFPVSGILNPMQSVTTNFLPDDDQRFRFHLFPINYAVPVADYQIAHAPLAGLWRCMNRDMIRELRKRAPRWKRRLERYIEFFDESFYVRVHADVQRELAKGNISRGFDHYVAHGFGENRFPFDFDQKWYSRTYPMAAFEVGQGDYSDFRHHFVEVGCMRGHRTLPM